MKKSILDFGNALNRAEQKEIFGGTPVDPFDSACGESSGQGCANENDDSCPSGEVCRSSFSGELQKSNHDGTQTVIWWGTTTYSCQCT